MKITTIRMEAELHDLLFNEVKWKEKKPVGTIIIEALKLYLTNKGYKV